MRATYLSLFVGISSALVLGTGCQKDDTSMEAALKRIDTRLQTIETKLEKGIAAAPAAAAGRAANPRGRRPPGPDPQAVYAVPIDGSPFKGAKDAKVTIVKAFEFACPFCLKVRPTLDQLLKDYPGEIKVVEKHLIVHPGSATIPAQAACAAHLQGKYSEMEPLIWEKGFSAGRDLSKDNMIKLAGEIPGMNVDKFTADLDGKTCKDRIASDQQDLRKVGARGTPAFFINGRFLSGARPIEQFKRIIDEELEKANDRLSKGARVAAYYDEFVVKKGKKSL